jgi:DNA-binding response OmpR family regulator
VSTALFLVDPEPASRGYLERHLRHDGFEIVADPERRPDLVIAEDASDFERWCGEAPVIVLGQSDGDHLDRVRAFRRGCDDYVQRPFHYDELLERIRAILRRVSPSPPDVVDAGPLTIDTRTRTVTVRGARVHVAQKEYELLLKLASDPDRVFTKHELLRDIWGYTVDARTRTLDSHASRLRKKLRAADPTTPFVENRWGVGYRLLGELGAAA